LKTNRYLKKSTIAIEKQMRNASTLELWRRHFGVARQSGTFLGEQYSVASPVVGKCFSTMAETREDLWQREECHRLQ
jgi:hypothetical protein